MGDIIHYQYPFVCRPKIMTPVALEQRVERLERIVEEMRHDSNRAPGQNDWRTTVGAFSNDSVADEIIEESLQIRENERRQNAS
jgi:hypothetical protein